MDIMDCQELDLLAIWVHPMIQARCQHGELVVGSKAKFRELVTNKCIGRCYWSSPKPDVSSTLCPPASHRQKTLPSIIATSH